MKIGIGIREDNRVDKNYLKFASQIGASHAVVFMPDKQILPSCDFAPWSIDELKDLKKFYAENGMKIEGFENFHPKIWYKVMLGMEGREEQLDYVKYCIANMGKAGIKTMGYNFSIAGVEGHIKCNGARGGAETVRFSADEAPINEPLPLGTVFRRIVDPNAPKGDLPPISLEEVVERYDWFLERILPVAEEAGVKMCAHPDDPPVPVMKRCARYLTNPQAYDEIFNKFKSTSNCIEFCQGTFGEMGVDVYETIKHFGSMDKIGYVHFRNIIGTIPNYTEVFIDEGDMDMVRSLKAYKECGYKGLLMPDHTPLANVENPTGTGMAYAIGYIRGIMNALEIDIED